MAQLQPRIIGTGWSLPKKKRLNDDPIFDWLRNQYPNQDLFTGYKVRHVLEPGEDLWRIMLPAAKKALANAGKKEGDIDILIGLASISPFITPNALSQLHKELGLPEHAWVIPVCDDFSNFASSLLIADALIRAGRAKNILVCIGSNWTTNVDYHTTQSISAADGAGAAVISMSSDKSKWAVADHSTVTNSKNYGTMFSAGSKKMIANLNANPPIYGSTEVHTQHSFTITPEGLIQFQKFGMEMALSAVTNLLKKNKITGADITFMPHQTSASLIDYWLKHLDPQPAQTLTTIKEVANITVATHALNLAWFEEKGNILQNKLVMFSLGPDMHANALMLQRG